MVNSDNGSIIPEIINSIAEVYNWEGFSGQVTKNIVPVHADTLESYVGTYMLDKIRLTVLSKDGKLFLAQDDSPPVRMYFTSPSEFFIVEVNATSEFQRNAERQVDGILIKQGGREFKAMRKQ